MAVRIRLKRTGKKNAPAFRIVAADAKAKRDGKIIETIGSYNPSTNPSHLSYKKERLEYWKSVGAKTSHAVEGILSGKYEFKKYAPKKQTKEKETPKAASEEETKK